jgi:hypothetical protein
MARNEVGLSSFSSEISILVAQNPEAPVNIVTYFSGASVQITWKDSYNGGTAILAYKIEI